MFENQSPVFTKNVSHSAASLSEFQAISDQLPYRRQMILEVLEDAGITLNGTDAFVGRGGGLFSVIGGTYEINSLLLEHAFAGINGVSHPAQLGSQLAHEFCLQYGGQGFVVNPPDVDEFHDLARITGIDGIYRSSHIHALNQKETAIRHAATIGKRYEECNFIVCHIGGGISVTAHQKGMMIDSNDIVEGDGPMAPTRCGAIPAAPLIRLCYSGQYTEAEMLNKCTQSGGFADILGTSDTLLISQAAENGDQDSALYWNAMIYQIIKYIGSMSTVLGGQVDGILLGGGMVYNSYLVSQITASCSFIAPISAYPGEFEMEAMAAGALRVLMGTESAKIYHGIPAWKPFDAANRRCYNKT